ncbi:Sodium- and chloride-dependent glycine transporter 2 [Blattella germanica]|nr:Sodium- and chloride-dependent glycine transporter 2 [Blattella germanica]
MAVLNGEKEIAKQDAPVEETPARGAWSNQLEFLLSCLNYAVGLGNVWRFPYLVFRNGGGAFLVPYIIMLFTMGLPIFFLELVVGQFSGLGPNKAFQRMAPIFHGLGYSTLVVITLITIYYQVIIAWTIFYIFATFSSTLGWGSCDHDFNTEECYSGFENAKCLDLANDTTGPLTYYRHTCYPVENICARHELNPMAQLPLVNQSLEYHAFNSTHCFAEDHGVTYYVNINKFITRILDYALGINGATWESWGILRWETALCLLLSWIILFLCLMKGVQSSGKVAYFTAFFPYCVLIALLIREVWGDAASQTFYALGIGCGSLVTLSSYNRFNNNCHRDAFFVCITNTATAILAGFVVFSILGFLAKELGVDVQDVVQSGPGLAFVTYPEAVLHMPVPHLWAILFFIMLFTLGIGSQFAGLEAMNTAIIDQWPQLRTKKHWVCAGTCTACFLLALPMCCSGGVYLFTLMDTNTASWAILIIGFAEIALVAWVYVFLIGVLVFTLYNYSPARYEGVHFPGWVDALGWLIGIASLLPMPLFAVYRLARGKEIGWDLLKPSILWGPSTSTTSLTSPLQNNSNITDNIENYQSCSSENNDNKAFSPTFHSESDLVKNTNLEQKSELGPYENLGFQSENYNKSYNVQKEF